MCRIIVYSACGNLQNKQHIPFDIVPTSQSYISDYSLMLSSIISQKPLWLFKSILRYDYSIVLYRIAGNFDVFYAFQPDSQNLTRQTIKSIQWLVKDSDHPSKYFPSNIWRVSICQNFPHQNFPLYGICFWHAQCSGILCILCVCMCLAVLMLNCNSGGNNSYRISCTTSKHS